MTSHQQLTIDRYKWVYNEYIELLKNYSPIKSKLMVEGVKTFKAQADSMIEDINQEENHELSFIKALTKYNLEEEYQGKVQEYLDLLASFRGKFKDMSDKFNDLLVVWKG